MAVPEFYTGKILYPAIAVLIGLSALFGVAIRPRLVLQGGGMVGKAAPELITGAMLERMRPGSVVVDLAAETGGNCAVTRPGERVEVNQVVVLGPLNVAASLPIHASQMFSRNVFTLVQHLLKDGKLVLDPSDEITRAMLLTYKGEVFAP